MSGEKWGMILGVIALLLSFTAYALGSAAFHPALMLTYSSVPIAFFAYLMGASRLPILAVFFGASAWFVIPVSKALSMRIDYLLALFFAIGCILAVFLYANYCRSHAAT
jgi:hypothetical protein